MFSLQYDASHPAALGLDGFERKSMAAAEFKELVRRTFHLKLTGTEVGALFDFFNNSDAPEVSVSSVLECSVLFFLNSDFLLYS